MTLKDVAKISGCSVATVSKVFKNSAEISEETKKRVILAAEKIGYLKKATTSPKILGGLKPVIFFDPEQKFISSLKELNMTVQRHGLSLLYVMLNSEEAKKLSAQIGAWGIISAKKTDDTEIYSFEGDFQGLSKKLEEMASFVPKRAPRTTADVPRKAKESLKPKVYERKKEDIWLL